MVTLVIALQQEQEAPRPIYPRAYDYYIDYYSEEEESTFIVIKDKWNSIKQNNSSDKTLTEKELKYIALINGFLKNSTEGVEYFSKEYLCERLNICDRQLRRIRTNTSHVFITTWRKKTKTYRGNLEKVYAIRPTEHTVFLLKETKYYKSVKLGHQCPPSIYKDENYIKEDRSSKSTFCKNSNSSRAKLYSPKFKQYDEPKNLGDHYPLTTEDCSELQRRSSREFTLNAMNEILLDMSRKLKEYKHEFPSKAAFMAYMSKVYRYEGRDAVKTANLGFKILTRATEAEVIAHTTQAERESYLAEVEQRAIIHRSDETQYRAKLAATLKPSQAYNFLSNLKAVCKVGDIFEVHMSQDVLLTNHSRGLILSAANAVGGYRGVEKLEFIVEQKEVTKHAN